MKFKVIANCKFKVIQGNFEGKGKKLSREEKPVHLKGSGNFLFSSAYYSSLLLLSIILHTSFENILLLFFCMYCVVDKNFSKKEFVAKRKSGKEVEAAFWECFCGRDKRNEMMVGGYCGSLMGYCLLVFEHLHTLY